MFRQLGVPRNASKKNRGDWRCQDGPEVLRTLNFLKDLDYTRNDFYWDETIRLTWQTESEPMASVLDIAQHLASSVAGHLLDGDFPLVIGGNHSCAIGTWSGVRTSRATSGETDALA